MVSNQELASSPIDLFRLAARWRSGPEWKKMEEELDSEPVPSHLNTINSSGLFNIVSTDKMSVQYVGCQHHGHDVGVVQADCPAPTRRFVYYFEMTVKNAGQKGQIAIGFTTQQFNMRRQPGWEANSCGYHGDDGCLYHGHGKGESFGPTFTSGDTIGAGINYASQEFFFTKNAKLVGIVPKGIKGPLYPTIAVHSQKEEATVNFGQYPFLFDIETFILEERMKLPKMVEKLSLQPDVSHWIVRSYLLHYGYQDTLNSFDIASEDTCPSSPAVQENGFGEHGDVYALSHRKVLRQDDTSIVCFLLHSQRFIEYIRVGFLEDAVRYARAELANFFSVKPFTELLEDIIALLAYNAPLESCVGYLLEMSQREFVADAVNAVVLSTNPNLKDPESCMCTVLEKLLRQLTLCSLERRAFNEDQGEAFYLHRELHGAGKAKY
ncbi:ran-binding protein M homolog isoform X2 [Phoenix dactylifera]|uniref:Ran-binding protein M homolog isoform X2 n=1 Tax=Phoenix dactylifera TaxID=42345 RepID=A0A8B9B002_PHODC|nr:ran-binding protein M homolog isoform X2 [Phoenix dactylifera]